MAIYRGIAIIVICINLAIAFGIHITSMKKYTILVDNAVHISEIVKYDTHLILTWSFILKFFLRFNEKDVIIQHISLIMFDGTMCNHKEVRTIKTIASAIAQTVDKIRYINACHASFLVFLRKSSSFNTSKIQPRSSFNIWIHFLMYFFVYFFKVSHIFTFFILKLIYKFFFIFWVKLLH